MISVFNGRSRALGEPSSSKVYIQVSVALRRHLHHFKGAKLSVFMAIALHSDERGWSSPSVKALRRETGYGKDTIFAALAELCTLTIERHRVLLRDNRRSSEGTFDNNSYLIFPSPEEVAKYEGQRGETQGETALPCPEKADTVKSRHGKKPTRTFSESEKPGHIVEPDRSQVEPDRSQQEPHTHNQSIAAPALPFGGEARVCVSDEVVEQDYYDYAHAHASFTTPDAWAATYWDARSRDKVVGEWKRNRQRARLEAPSAEPPRHGMTFALAATIVNSETTSCGSDPLTVINRLDVDDDVRARLVETFVREARAEAQS
jgi:hypothetical protein